MEVEGGGEAFALDFVDSSMILFISFTKDVPQNAAENFWTY